MADNDVMNRLNDEIKQSTNGEMFSIYDKNVVDNVIQKIVEGLSNEKFGSNFFIDRFDVTTGENKNGEKLFYVKGSFFSHNASEATYYAFNAKGEYVGCVKAFVCNVVPPTQVEIEYWSSEEHKNKGNMTVLARDVIKDIFEKRSFDNFHIRDGLPTSNIDSIVVAINKDNYPSLAVAKKLGFDENGLLHINDYEQSKDISSENNINESPSI